MLQERKNISVKLRLYEEVGVKCQGGQYLMRLSLLLVSFSDLSFSQYHGCISSLSLFGNYEDDISSMNQRMTEQKLHTTSATSVVSESPILIHDLPGMNANRKAEITNLRHP